MIEAGVEEIVRDKLLMGLDAVVSDFDFSEPRPKVRYPKNAPIPIAPSITLWPEGTKYAGKLVVDICPNTPWFRIETRVAVMKEIDRRLGDLTEIHLDDDSQWRQVEKYNSMYHRTTPDEAFNTCAVYERVNDHH